MLGNFSCFCYPLLTISKLTISKILPERVSECQMVWIPIRTDVLIWVQTVCKLFAKVISKQQKLRLLRNKLSTFDTLDVSITESDELLSDNGCTAVRSPSLTDPEKQSKLNLLMDICFLFASMHYIPVLSTGFQSCRDTFWTEPLLSRG